MPVVWRAPKGGGVTCWTAKGNPAGVRAAFSPLGGGTLGFPGRTASITGEACGPTTLKLKFSGQFQARMLSQVVSGRFNLVHGFGTLLWVKRVDMTATTPGISWMDVSVNV